MIWGRRDPIDSLFRLIQIGLLMVVFFSLLYVMLAVVAEKEEGMKPAQPPCEVTAEGICKPEEYR